MRVARPFLAALRPAAGACFALRVVKKRLRVGVCSCSRLHSQPLRPADAVSVQISMRRRWRSWASHRRSRRPTAISRRRSVHVATTTTPAGHILPPSTWQPPHRAHAAQVLSPSLVANAVGCTIMGLLVGSGPLILPRFPALYAGATAGFCGSATSFSTWSVEVASIFARGQARSNSSLTRAPRRIKSAYVRLTVTRSLAASSRLPSESVSPCRHSAVASPSPLARCEDTRPNARMRRPSRTRATTREPRYSRDRAEV